MDKQLEDRILDLASKCLRITANVPVCQIVDSRLDEREPDEPGSKYHMNDLVITQVPIDNAAYIKVVYKDEIVLKVVYCNDSIKLENDGIEYHEWVEDLDIYKLGPWKKK